MRNITASVPDEVYTAARTYANRYNTSISSIVADFLFTLRHLSESNDLMHPRRALEPLNDKEFIPVARHVLDSRN
jgi:hypothetical protein